MSQKNIKEFRNKLFALYERRSKYIDPRSYNSFEQMILRSQKPKLDKLKFILSNIKQFKTTLTKKNFNETYETIQKQIKQQTTPVDTEKLVIDNKNISFYESYIHYVQIFESIKKNGKYNKMYNHSIKFYEAKNKLSNEYKPINAFFSGFSNKKQIKNEIKNKIIVDSDQPWIVDEFIRESDNKNRFVIIETNAYKRVNVDISKQQENIRKQLFRASESGYCVYDGMIKYFSGFENNKNAKAILNKLINGGIEKIENRIKELEESKLSYKLNKALKGKEVDDIKDKNIIKTIEKINNEIESLKQHNNIYKKPYSIEELEELGKEFNISFTIKDLINKNNTITINKNCYNRFNLEFINTKYNHVDLLCTNSNSVINLNENDYENTKQTLDFYVEKFGTIFSPTGSFKKVTDFNDVFNAWKTKNNFNKLSIRSDSNAYKFLKSYNYDMHRFFTNDLIIDNLSYIELDLKAAFYNYSDNKYNKFYMGVPSGSFMCVKPSNFTINDYKELKNNKLIGFYEIKITKSSDKFNTYGFTVNSTHILFSSMIDLLISNNIEFDIIQYMVAPSVHIPFTEDFKKTTSEDIKYYSKAVGQMMCYNEDNVINIKPLDNDAEYYKTISDQYDGIYKYNDLYKIIINNKYSNVYHHIAYSIHSYVNTLVLEQMIKLDTSDVIGVKFDSIVLKADTFNSTKYEINKDIFKFKFAKIEKMFNSIKTQQHINYDLDDSNNDIIRPFVIESKSEIQFNEIFTQNKENIYKRVCFIGGMGGSGKTSSILNSSCFDKNQICFTTTCWNLITEQIKMHPEIIGLSLPKITGKMAGNTVDKANDSNIRYLIIDEATLVDSDIINEIIHNFPHCFIFILGDVERNGKFYQCSVMNKVIKPKDIKECQYIKYTKSYRFDNELNNRLLKLRNLVKSNGNTTSDKYYIYDCFIKLFSDCIVNDISELNFNERDIGISAKKNIHNNKCLISDYFVSKGAKPIYQIKQTVLGKSQLKGQFFHEEPDHNNIYMSLFKTIHSFQGCQLENDDSKIIIYIDSLFDINLFYTAASRARRCSQIKIISKSIDNDLIKLSSYNRDMNNNMQSIECY